MAFASFLCSAAQTLFLLHAASSFLQASVGLPPPPFWAFALHSISFLHNAFFWQAFFSASNSLLPSFLGCGLGLAFLFLFMTFFTTSANNCLFLPFLVFLFGPCCCCFFFLSLLSGPFCFLSLLLSGFFLSVSFFFSGCFFVAFFLSWGLPCCPFLESAMAFASFLCSAAQTLFLLHAASSFLQA